MGQSSGQGWQQLKMGSLCGSGAKLAAAHRPAAQSGQRRCPHPAAPESAPAECQDAINLKPVINETVTTVLLCTTCLSRWLGTELYSQLALRQLSRSPMLNAFQGKQAHLTQELEQKAEDMNGRGCEGCQAGQEQLRIHFKLGAGHCRHHTL